MAPLRDKHDLILFVCSDGASVNIFSAFEQHLVHYGLVRKLLARTKLGRTVMLSWPLVLLCQVKRAQSWCPVASWADFGFQDFLCYGVHNFTLEYRAAGVTSPRQRRSKRHTLRPRQPPRRSAST